MKKLFLFAALTAAFSLTSCSDDDDMTAVSSNSVDTDAKAIVFTVNDGDALTRSGDVTSLSSMKVTGVTTTGDETYFSNETFSLASGVFSSATPYYWPSSGSMDFYATNTGTISYASGTATMSITGTDGTTDYVAACSKNTLKQSSIALSFKHIMSRVGVKVKPADSSDGYDYVITGITLSAIGSGKYTFPAITGGVGTWSDQKDYKTYSWSTGLPATTGSSNSGKVITLSEAYYLIPSSTNLTFDVEYKVYKNGVLLYDCTGDDCGSIDISASSLAAGKSVYFVLEPIFSSSGLSKIAFTSSVTAWGTATDLSDDYEV